MPKTVTTNSVDVYYNTEKKVCRTSDGTIHVIVMTPNTVAHHHSHNEGDSWSSVNIWSGLAAARTCAMDVDGNDNLVAVRYNAASNVIFKKGTVSKSDPNHWTWTWGGETTLTCSLTTYHPDIIVDGNNYYHVVSYCTQTRVYWWRSTDGGVNWTLTEILGWANTYNIPTITKDSANNLYVFAAYSDGNLNLQACKITYSAGPSWSVGSIYNVTTTAAGMPSANVLSDNRLIVSYSSNTGNCRFKKSTNPSDITSWNTEIDIATGIFSAGTHSLGKVMDAKIRVYYIKTTVLYYKESTDGGNSFGTQQTEYNTGTNQSPNCAKKAVNNKIDFVWRNGASSPYTIFLNTVVGFVNYYRQVVELLGLLETRSRVKNIHRVFSDYLGLYDLYTRTKEIYRIFSEKLGLLDTMIHHKWYHRLVSEMLGLKESILTHRTMHRIAVEYLGLTDTWSRVKSIHRIFTEYLGLKDTYSRTKHIYRTFMDSLSLKESRGMKKHIYKIVHEYLGLAERLLAYHHYVGSKYWRKEHPEQRVRSNV